MSGFDTFPVSRLIVLRHQLQVKGALALELNLCYTGHMKLALKVTPQRSTQYTQMTTALALPELQVSPLHQTISQIEPIRLAGHDYLLATADDDFLSHPATIPQLSRLGTISEFFEYFESTDTISGPLLRPIEPQYTPFVPPEMAEARRYRGKTNEIFTRVLLNVALFASSYASDGSERLRILDPLAGGCTTLFMALAAGHDVFGIEIDRQDIESSVGFTRQFLEGERVPFKEMDERRKIGRRYLFEVGPKNNTRHFVLAQGNCWDALVHMREVPGGPRMHAIVGDLPYGIQHFGEIAQLLSASLPAWEQMLFPGGTIALAWNATRIERSALVDLFQQHTSLTVHNEPPYTSFSHSVDRVIKKRDILVATRKV